jgi:MinD-like ATPase involved in chromosome partitioning or flagellar assembly
MDVLGEIPYDISVPKAIANGQPVVAAYPDAVSSRQINRIAEALLDAVPVMT